jgi:C_GCAxxG_C_C family probable redox protein
MREENKDISKEQQEAVGKFEKGFACSQSVFSTYAGPMGLAQDTALKISDAFGGGMGGMGETCGAVTGAYMVLGLINGRTEADDDESKKKTRKLIKEFTQRFKEAHKTTICNELLENDISTPEGMEAAEASGVFDKRCPKFVAEATKILEQLIKKD